MKELNKNLLKLKKKKTVKSNLIIMYQYEYDRLIGSLATMINIPNFKVHPDVFTLSAKQGLNLYKTLDIATFWLDNCKIIPFPIQINRRMPDGRFEDWNPMEMLLPHEVETCLSFDHEIKSTYEENLIKYKKNLNQFI